MPGIVGAALLVFALSMDEFLITYFVSGQKGTMTMYIWSLLKDGIAPRVNALATVLILASFVLLLVGNWLTSKNSTGDRRR
jgi:spermidine/putrescine transport system permease protein